MNLSGIVLNYPVDNKEGMRQPITGFLKDVMKEEAAQQAEVPGYAGYRRRRAHRNG